MCDNPVTTKQVYCSAACKQADYRARKCTAASRKRQKALRPGRNGQSVTVAEKEGVTPEAQK